MRVNIKIDDSNFLHFHVVGGGHYKSPESLSRKEQSEINDIAKKAPAMPISLIRRQQAARLKAFVPMDFHRLIRNKYLTIKKRGMTLILDQTLTADLPWEFIPLIERDTDDEQFPVEWQELPLMRTLLGSSYRGMTIAKEELVACFFQTKKEASNPLGTSGHVLSRKVDFSNILMKTDKCDLVTARSELLRRLSDCDFIMIASHAEKDAFLTDGQAPYCKAAAIKPVRFPRFVLADCCHSAENGLAGSGNRATEWPETLLKAFIRQEGSAVYIGNIGAAKYRTGLNGQIESYFAGDIIKRLFTDKTWQGSFTEALRMTRFAQRNDQDNSQVVYIAADYDPSCSFEDILGKAVLPPVPGSPVDWRGGLIIGAAGLLSVPLLYYVSGIWHWKAGAAGILIAAFYITVSWGISIYHKSNR